MAKFYSIICKNSPIYKIKVLLSFLGTGILTTMKEIRLFCFQKSLKHRKEATLRIGSKLIVYVTFSLGLAQKVFRSFP
jgi:hypothetical protein